MGYKSYSHITCTSSTEVAIENIAVGINKKYTQWETSRTLKIGVFKLLGNTNIEKLFSKYKTFFLD